MTTRMFFILAAVLIWLGTPGWAHALDLEEAREIALERDEELAALEAEARGTREQSVADGALPDPELGVGYMNLPTDSFSTREDMMTQLQLTARQRFPAGRTRELSTAIGESQADAVQLEAEAREREVRREVGQAWSDWYYSHQMLVLAREAEATFEQYVAITHSRYASGTGTQRALNRARLERAALEERILELERERDDARAQLARWVGRSALVDAAPGDAEIPSIPDGQLRDQLVEHPRVQAAETRRIAEEQEIDRVRQSYRPEWMVEFTYGHRRARDGGGEQMPDMFSGMVGVSVPLFTRNRQDREVAAAREAETAATHRRADLVHELDGQLQQAESALERYRDLIALYEDALLDEAALSVALKLDAYRADREDFRELIRARVDELDYQLRLLGVERDRDRHRFELEYLVGETP